MEKYEILKKQEKSKKPGNMMSLLVTLKKGSSQQNFRPHGK